MLDHAVQIVRMNQRKTAVWMVGDDGDVRWLILAPSNESDIACAPIWYRGTETFAQTLAQGIIPRLSPISRDILGLKSSTTSRKDDESQTIQSPRLSAAMPPSCALQLTGGGHERRCTQT
jgi:hypothetical protein